MLFQNEKPRHITLIKNDKYPRSFQILENYKEANNNEENVYKSINFNRKSRLKPLNHNYNLNDDEGEKIVLPKIGTRSSVKEIKIISNNILEETEKEIKKRIKHSNRQKNIKIKINIENININNTVIIKEEEKIIKDNVTIDNTKFINTAKCYYRLNNKRSIFQMINQLMINHNYKKVLMFLKANNIETCNLKFINTILNFKITQNKKSFDKMFKLLKFFVFITLKLSKRNFFKMLKKNKETYDLKRESCVVHIQKIFKGFYFRKNNKHLNEKNKAIKNSIIKIQKHLRGVLSRNRNQDYLKSFKEFKRIQQMKKDYLIQRKVVLKQSAAIRVIEEFWLAILERRDDEKLEQQIANMPEECRNLYIKFVNLRKQTNNLKKDLVKIGMKK